DDRQVVAHIAPAPHVAGDLAAQGGRDSSALLAGPVQQKPAPGTGLALAGERVEQLHFGLRPDSGNASQSTGGCGLPELVGGPDAERSRQLDRSLGAQPEVAAEADEIGREL